MLQQGERFRRLPFKQRTEMVFNTSILRFFGGGFRQAMVGICKTRKCVGNGRQVQCFLRKTATVPFPGEGSAKKNSLMPIF